jgi:hypothetical protein
VHISAYCKISSFGSSSLLTQGVWAEVNVGNEHLRLSLAAERSRSAGIMDYADACRRRNDPLTGSSGISRRAICFLTSFNHTGDVGLHIVYCFLGASNTPLKPALKYCYLLYFGLRLMRVSQLKDWPTRPLVTAVFDLALHGIGRCITTAASTSTVVGEDREVSRNA